MTQQPNTHNPIHPGDALAVLRSLAAGSVHTVVTSPPYWGLRDYGLPLSDWPPVTFSPAAGLPPLTVPAMSCCLGLEPEPWAFVAHLVAVFRELRRVLRDDGTCWVNLGDSYANDEKWGGAIGGKHAAGLHGNTGIGRQKVSSGLKPKDLCGLPWRVALALQADGWWLRSDIIWAKPNPMPESVTDRPTKAHEYVFLLAKSERYYYDAEAVAEPAQDWGIRDRTNGKYHNAGTGLQPHGGLSKSYSARNRRTVWRIATQPYSGAHFATFPPKLVEPCILAGTSARGVCPACGAPWARVVEVVGYDRQRWAPGEDQYHTQAKGEHGATSAFTTGDVAVKNTLGWRPTCDCQPADPQPAVVLDPFFGSGTVGQVAIETGRRYVGIELNEEYIELSRQRLAAAQPALFGRGL